jgi:nucleotide-binding universal stress UspA family protein
MFAVRTILFPTDFSESASAAFPLAAVLARDHAARLVVLHVATPPPFVTPTELERALADHEGYRRQLEAELHRHPPPGPPTSITYRLADGDPAAEILRVAREEGADLIVLGTHGRVGLVRFLLGSVAEAVLRRAACPVLTVRGPLLPTPARATEARRRAGSGGRREGDRP